MKYFFGFSYWKHDFIQPFFQDTKDDIVFINPFFKKNYFNLALKKGLNKHSSIYIWGKKSFPLVEEFAKKNAIPIYRVEDGFIRSVGLGSDLTQPYSLIVDKRGIYFDPSQESDLEYILQTTHFSDSILHRAKKIKQYLIEQKLSKYNLYTHQDINIPTNKKIVLVPGQVEDDASIKYGANKMTNLELLKEARQNAQDAYIIYKPHPDVLVGNRVGHIDKDIALQYANQIITEVSLDSVLSIAHEVHTMTSLVGFEALLRGKTVFTYGIPFYAGWGLTKDKHIISRRTKKLSLEALIAGTLILYPRYIHPKTKKICEIEELLYELDKEKKLYNSSKYYQITTKIRNFFSRKSQLLLRIIYLKR
ncbi:Capsular polysaccharide export system protein KpsC [hydrothermal vent metagenome]|uniref:Capsular polysaccharide export system protein KpsC n=1 Tax=hydrothermal vent metagenome TaxID=652676 RepID=A0A1W1D540_9ZZZZ